MPAMPPPARHASPIRDHVPFWVATLIIGVTGLVVVSLFMDLFFPTVLPALARPTGPVATPAPANADFPGLTTFRGNDSRSYYGDGPVPSTPRIRWRYPLDGSKMCAQSAETQTGPTKEWCGTGWTGQPNVVPAPGGGMEVREGAFDDAYHFMDAGTGADVLPPLMTGDLAKGSATTDPDGYPLYYAGSRDNLFRIVAMDRSKPTVLWTIDANTSVPDPMWNDDWDGAALIVGDYLLEGGENSWFYVIRLNRGYNARHLVTVDPQIVATIKGWDPELLAAIGDQDVSIENSVAYRKGIVYFANSGGLVQGWDISDLLKGGDRYHEVSGSGPATTPTRRSSSTTRATSTSPANTSG